MAFPSLPQDKANHFMYGTIVFLVGAIICLQFPILGLAPALGGLMLSSIAAVGKELVDAAINFKATGNPMKGPHGVEILDFAATAAGGAVCYLASYLA